ncbi:MAG: hypothetical protein H6711_10345 [Myxococcales bacterium]|nr:hypothetical protein [Myxococcales bacterium]
MIRLHALLAAATLTVTSLVASGCDRRCGDDDEDQDADAQADDDDKCLPEDTDTDTDTDTDGDGGGTSDGNTFPTSITPLVLVLDGGPVRYQEGVADTFRLDARVPTTTAWPTAATPWLVLDRDGDGRIGDGGELFGSMTPLAAGGRAQDGFEALRELDANADGVIDARDPAYVALAAWADDGDRRSSAGELTSLAELGVTAIDLGYRVDRRCDGRGNCEIERSTITVADALGRAREAAIVDVHLAVVDR